MWVSGHFEKREEGGIGMGWRLEPAARRIIVLLSNLSYSFSPGRPLCLVSTSHHTLCCRQQKTSIDLTHMQIPVQGVALASRGLDVTGASLSSTLESVSFSVGSTHSKIFFHHNTNGSKPPQGPHSPRFISLAKALIFIPIGPAGLALPPSTVCGDRGQD